MNSMQSAYIPVVYECVGEKNGILKLRASYTPAGNVPPEKNNYRSFPANDDRLLEVSMQAGQKYIAAHVALQQEIEKV